MDGSEIRIGTAERESAAEVLQAHCLAGRLTLEELEDRLGEAMRARTRGDLAVVMRELPAASIIAPAPPAAPRPSRPGTAPFTERMRLGVSPRRARETALVTLAPALHESGFELVEQTEQTLVFDRRESLTVPLIGLVVFPPVGVLMLLARRREQRIVFSFVGAEEGGTLLTIHGRGSRRVRRQLWDACATP